MSNFKCPNCGSKSNWVTDCRPNQDGVRRRRECEGCGERFNTLEVIVTEISPKRPKRCRPRKGPGVQKRPNLIPVSNLQDLKNLQPEQRRKAFDQALARAKARVERERRNGNGAHGDDL